MTSPEEWNVRKIALLVANLCCCAYIIFLVVHPQSKDGPWPSVTRPPSSEVSGEATVRPSTPITSPPQTQVETPGTPAAAADESPPAVPQTPDAARGAIVTRVQKLADDAWGRYVALGRQPFSPAFPTEDVLTVTSDEMAWKRQRRVYDYLACFGDDNLAQASAPYDVAFLPIGCFGDIPGQSCLSTSCYFARSLANATFCGKKKFGAFLGDNFYPNGLKRDNDPRFDRDLNAKFFRHGALRMRYYAMVGNHDRRPSTQIRRVGQHPFWYMPAFNYTGDLIRSGATTVQVFVIDTHYGFDLNYPHMQAQAEWLDRELAASTALWKVVMSHEPVFCFADFDHSRSLLDFVHPVLKKHKIQLFVAAHVHGVMLHKVDGGYYQLTAAGFADNVHTHVKAKRPRGYYHLGRGAAAVYFTPTHADVVAFMPDASTVFTHRIPVTISSKVDVTDAAVRDAGLFTSRHACEALLPEVPKFCQDYAATKKDSG